MGLGSETPPPFPSPLETRENAADYREPSRHKTGRAEQGGKLAHLLGLYPFRLGRDAIAESGTPEGLGVNTSKAEPRMPRRERTINTQPPILGTIPFEPSRTGIDAEMPSFAWRGSSCFIVLARFR